MFPVVVIITDINTKSSYATNACIGFTSQTSFLQLLFLMLFALYHLGLEIAVGWLVCAVLALVLLNTGKKKYGDSSCLMYAIAVQTWTWAGCPLQSVQTMAPPQCLTPFWSRVLLLARWIPPWIPLLAFTSLADHNRSLDAWPCVHTYSVGI